MRCSYRPLLLEMLLADENIPAATIAYLRAQRLDVLSVREITAGMADEAVLALAVAESRILLTFDRDYGELIFRHGKTAPRSVIYLRVYPPTVDEINARLLWLLHGGAGALDDQMVVVSQEGIRKRLFPRSAVSGSTTLNRGRQ
jgi:predicted nuclease of predicted toxin-antitoxin system